MYPYSNYTGYQPYQPMQAYQQNSGQVTRVHGEDGARAYQMMPNCSALLLDESEPRVFLIQTDGAGYKSITPYKIEPYTQAPEADMTGLEARIRRLEDLYESYTNAVNGQNSGRTSRADETANKSGAKS